MSDQVVLTHQGWAATASIFLANQIPELVGKDPEIQSILSPLFAKAMRRAAEHAIETFHQGNHP